MVYVEAAIHATRSPTGNPQPRNKLMSGFIFVSSLPHRTEHPACQVRGCGPRAPGHLIARFVQRALHVACNAHAFRVPRRRWCLAALARPMLIAAPEVHDGSAWTSVVGCVYAAMCCFCIVDCIGADEPSRSRRLAWGCGRGSGAGRAG